MTQSGMTMGTAAYMSPEQARGEEVDHKTDIWSLGVVLYEMVTGQPPFKGDYEQAVVYSVLNEEPQPPTALRSEVPAKLERIIIQSLAKDPDERYRNAEELLEALRNLKKKLKLQNSTAESGMEKPTPSIAVLPFTNISADPEQEYFCDGMAEEIINALTQLDGLRVVARTSAFAFKGKSEDVREIGRQLNVSTILEGSVRKAGTRVRITAQLINVADGYHLWSEKYDRDLEDVFAVQDEISQEITHKLKGKLLGEDKEKLVKKPVEDLEAYQLFLKGRYFRNRMTRADLNRALDYFQQAIARMPDFAPAYAGLASTYMSLSLCWIIFHQERVGPGPEQLRSKPWSWMKPCPMHILRWDWQSSMRTGIGLVLRKHSKGHENSIRIPSRCIPIMLYTIWYWERLKRPLRKPGKPWRSIRSLQGPI
ncbi:MAG: hypothetical protein D6820_13520 [Lentisphaerae bacterium]|nr:MAG: hypothetical protein D6820_13520 [Lentisphaerota bacterium]